MYLVLLDASRAFDRVQYIKLFRLLRKYDICPLTCRFLAYMHANSESTGMAIIVILLSTSNGVKQGEILHPILFCVYMDELTSRLKQRGVGYFSADISI